MNDTQIRQTFFDCFPNEFIEDILRLIAQEVKSAATQCYLTFPKEEAFDVLGSYRRAGIESKLREIAELYPGINAEPISNKKNGRGNFHTEIKVEQTLLTVHKVQYKRSPVRKAKFRDSLAQRSEISLFAESATPSSSEGTILYAILKYGTDTRMPQALSFAVVDFPDKEGRVVHTIDLLSMDQYADIPTEFVRFSTAEEIEDNLNLNFRPDAKKKALEDNDDDIASEQ